MVQEAETNREADVKRREIVDARNGLDAMIFATEKMISENGDKITEEQKKQLQTAIAEAKEKVKVETLEELQAATKKLESESHKVATELYQPRLKRLQVPMPMGPPTALIPLRKEGHRRPQVVIPLLTARKRVKTTWWMWIIKKFNE